MNSHCTPVPQHDTTAHDDEVAWPPLTIIDTSFTDIDAAATIMCAGFRLTLFITVDELLETQPDDKASHLARFQTYLENRGDLIDEFEEWAITPCLPFLHQLQAVGQQLPRPRLLADYLQPPTFALKLQSHRGMLMPFPCKRDLSYEATIFGECSLTDLALTGLEIHDVQSFRSDELTVSKQVSSIDEEFCAIPRSVQATHKLSQTMAYKSISSIDSFRREVATLLKVWDRLPDSKINIPRFVAFVEHPNGGSIQGFLSTHIDNAQSMMAVHDEYDATARRMWMCQIREAVGALHEAGLTWGDAKPDNVLIDKDGNAWVIDFGGGWSPPWVDGIDIDSPGTDLRALARIEAWLLKDDLHDQVEIQRYSC